MSSAICFNLNQSKILSSGNGSNIDDPLVKGHQGLVDLQEHCLRARGHVTELEVER